MGLDRDKILAAAERQLKAGRTEAAVGDLRRLASSSPNDPSLLNRIGDFLSRARRVDESIEYYDRAADRFARSGLYPKAIAVGKKILRLRPDRVETLVTVGEWYLEQKLPGEARSFLLHAADHFLEARSFDRARGVYERLVEADPGDPRHRARLAEALAAEGKIEEAGNHMLALASSAEGEARESVYRRAMELLPGRDEPIRGLVDVLVGSDREQDAVDFLEARSRDGEIGDVLRAELAILYERVGRNDAALEEFSRVDPVQLPVGLVERFARARLERGGVDGFWECFDRRPAAVEGGAGAGSEAAVRLLERLTALEPSGHVPALERLVALSDGDARIARLERLLSALRKSGQSDAASDVAERLAELRGPEPVEESGDEQEDGAEAEPGRAEESALEAVADDEAAETGGMADVPVEVEAPAVPLNRSDEDFVAGRLTQAEILEKYGLRDQAIEQVREVVGRFPGHVDAQSRLVRLLEEGGSAADLRDALVQEAFALRAAGDPETARRSARRAAESAPLDEDTVSILAALGLHRTVDEEASSGSDREGPGGRDARAGTDAHTPATEDAAEDDEVLIDFAGDGDVRVEVETAADSDDATEPDDLTVLAEALESEALSGAEDDGWVPAAPEEQSLEDVLSAFKDRVQEEVEADDFRTHYDLAIGYKEMGMLDEAVASFEIATRSPELRLEALILMAVVRREQGRPVDAARLYREALDAASQDAGSTRRLRYDLADTLVQAGDDREALEVFRELLEADPQFRDVGVKVEEIERRLHG